MPGWREKALCCLPVDRLVKSRRAQGCRPEGFTGLCSFLCGGSVSAITGPPIPRLVPPASAATQLYSKKRFLKNMNPRFTKPFLLPPPLPPPPLVRILICSFFSHIKGFRSLRSALLRICLSSHRIQPPQQASLSRSPWRARWSMTALMGRTKG